MAMIQAWADQTPQAEEVRLFVRLWLGIFHRTRSLDNCGTKFGPSNQGAVNDGPSAVSPHPSATANWLNNGLELYRFRYKGSDRTTYVGVMAQDVQQIEPSAVWRDQDGYLMVNYNRIGVRFMTWKAWRARAGTNPSLSGP